MQRWYSFGRSDLVLLKVLLAGSVVTSIVGWVVLPVVRWVRGEDLVIHFAGPAQVSQLSGTGVRVSGAEYDLLLPRADTAQRVVDLLPGLLSVAVVAFGALVLHRLVTSIASGDAFVRANVRRLGILAGLVIAGSALMSTARGFADLVVLDRVDDLGSLTPEASISISLVSIVVGLLVALLMEAFAHGTRLRDDVDGLV